MSESYRLTRIEELDREQPGLEDFVRGEMKLGRSLQELAEQLRKRYAIHVSPSTLHSYWTRRFNPDFEAERQAYRKAKAQVEVLVSECGADPTKDATKILAQLLRSHIFKQQEKLEEADVLKLLAEERKRQELEQRQQEIEIEKGKLQVALQNAETAAKEATAKIEAQKRAVKEATDEAERKIGKGESITIEDINRIRERTFGLPAITSGHADSPIPAAVD